VYFPPSFPRAAFNRAFAAPNGELGVLPSDAETFLDACDRDGVGVLGWELWLVDHRWGASTGLPVQSDGEWCGGIPLTTASVPAICGGEGDSCESRRQLAELPWREIEPLWLPFVRVNFTLQDRR
jgi:hypothetical protein